MAKGHGRRIIKRCGVLPNLPEVSRFGRQVKSFVQGLKTKHRTAIRQDSLKAQLHVMKEGPELKDFDVTIAMGHC